MPTRRTFASLLPSLAVACAAQSKEMLVIPSIVELRQYTLHPGQRDMLIDLFEREFVESQEAQGMRILGTFRDLDDPDRFVWIRAFRDMTRRREALASFYGGPVWRAHREAANATMIDSDNVLLLHPVDNSSLPANRPPPGARELPSSIFAATVYPTHPGSEADFARFFERRVKPLLTRQDARLVATFATEHSENTFPALPVRGETVFVALLRFDTLERYEALRGASDASLADEIEPRLIAAPQILRLQPTARSLLR
jgi:quinol monooxygenase YgiN